MCENPTPFLPEYWQLDDMDQLKSMIGSLISEWLKHRIVDTKVAGTSQRIESTIHPNKKSSSEGLKQTSETSKSLRNSPRLSAASVDTTTTTKTISKDTESFNLPFNLGLLICHP